MSPTSYKLPVGGYYNNYRQLIAEEGGCFFIIFSFAFMLSSLASVNFDIILTFLLV